jgi:hypothetical protein
MTGRVEAIEADEALASAAQRNLASQRLAPWRRTSAVVYAVIYPLTIYSSWI